MNKPKKNKPAKQKKSKGLIDSSIMAKEIIKALTDPYFRMGQLSEQMKVATVSLAHPTILQITPPKKRSRK